MLLTLFGCAPSTEKRIEEISMSFGEKLHANSLMNPSWYDEMTVRLDEAADDIEPVNGQLISFDINEIYPEFIEHIEKEYAELCTEEGLQALKKHLIYNRFHEEEEKVEFVKVTEYENSYESIIDVTSSHYVLRFHLTFMKGEETKVNGFKVIPLEFANPE